MVRYTLLRFLVFFGCLALLWLLGLRSRDEEVWLVAGAAVLSLAISFVVLRPFRNEASETIQRRVDARREAMERKAAASAAGRDAAEEDAEDEVGRTRSTPDDFR
ncbi:conserved exported hypothetical protein [Nostocoides japonicum T1-X7]|uniref:DUF4229 domain-containing protein n=1 Tax=Nostocoides japonicum T1-X7 TaxID=1194083 RepID=A0A077LYQ7_9MICO|nr:DUF4229 domain-containing protein [Tetrasphaera japonica]CCH77104.1 conserved exported hypothetical protein [Tetrasphaera japonica T1-X7]